VFKLRIRVKYLWQIFTEYSWSIFLIFYSWEQVAQKKPQNGYVPCRILQWRFYSAILMSEWCSPYTKHILLFFFFFFFFQESPAPAKNLVACIRRRRSTLRYINYFWIFSPTVSASSSEYFPFCCNITIR